MKGEYLNTTLMPPTKICPDDIDKTEATIEYVRANFAPDEIYDISKIEKAAAIPFAEYLSFYYTTVKTEKEYRHKRDGRFYTSAEVWDEYNSPSKLK